MVSRGRKRLFFFLSSGLVQLPLVLQVTEKSQEFEFTIGYEINMWIVLLAAMWPVVPLTWPVETVSLQTYLGDVNKIAPTICRWRVCKLSEEMRFPRGVALHLSWKLRSIRQAAQSSTHLPVFHPYWWLIG